MRAEGYPRPRQAMAANSGGRELVSFVPEPATAGSTSLSSESQKLTALRYVCSRKANAPWPGGTFPLPGVVRALPSRHAEHGDFDPTYSSNSSRVAQSRHTKATGLACGGKFNAYVSCRLRVLHRLLVVRVYGIHPFQQHRKPGWPRWRRRRWTRCVPPRWSGCWCGCWGRRCRRCWHALRWRR